MRPNKTIVGVGDGATINGGGFDFYRSYNVIVRNLTFANAEDDAINVGQESHHIWIDHNTFVAPVDGSIDIVRGADYVTVSWNHFAATDKSMLIGHSDGGRVDRRRAPEGDHPPQLLRPLAPAPPAGAVRRAGARLQQLLPAATSSTASRRP